MKIQKSRKVLLVSDGKRGHEHQTRGVVDKLGNVTVRQFDIAMSTPYYLFLIFVSMLARRLRFNNAQILFWLQRVTQTRMETLIKYEPDVIISAGSLTHPVTYLLGKLWKCPTVICMRPSLLSPRDFGLVVAPRHDARKCRGDNVLYTMGATSHISEAFIFAEAVALRQSLRGEAPRPVGLLVGGNSAMNYITRDMASELCQEVLLACEENGLDLLATTSRRTPPDAEQVFARELAEHDRCPYLLLASQSDANPVPGIIGLCDVVVVTEDSVSMVSEIISGGKAAVVVQVGRRKKRNKFITLYEDLNRENYITYTTIDKLNPALVAAMNRKDNTHKALDESAKVAGEIERRFFSGSGGSGVKK
jgi:hypothetical protein